MGEGARSLAVPRPENAGDGGRDESAGEEAGSLCVAGGKVEWCSHCGKVWRFLRKFGVSI